jgi:hypothetical protein
MIMKTGSIHIPLPVTGLSVCPAVLVLMLQAAGCWFNTSPVAPLDAADSADLPDDEGTAETDIIDAAEDEQSAMDTTDPDEAADPVWDRIDPVEVEDAESEDAGGEDVTAVAVIITDTFTDEHFIDSYNCLVVDTSIGRVSVATFQDYQENPSMASTPDESRWTYGCDTPTSLIVDGDWDTQAHRCGGGSAEFFVDYEKPDHAFHATSQYKIGALGIRTVPLDACFGDTIQLKFVSTYSVYSEATFHCYDYSASGWTLLDSDYDSGAAYEHNYIFEEGVFWTTYYDSGELVSANLTAGHEVSGIMSFRSIASSVPSGSTLAVQFSQDGSDWYDSSGIPDSQEEIAEGTQTLNLSSLGWSGPGFYYRMIFVPYEAETPALDEISVTITTPAP